MKRLLKITLILTLLSSLVLTESCKKRDCRGRKKTAKTNMGGWL
jgi:hypothetical protein